MYLSNHNCSCNINTIYAQSRKWSNVIDKKLVVNLGEYFFKNVHKARKN